MTKTILTGKLYIASPLEQFNTSGFFVGKQNLEDEILDYSFNNIPGFTSFNFSHEWTIHLYDQSAFWDWDQYGAAMLGVYGYYWFAIFVQNVLESNYKFVKIQFVTMAAVASWLLTKLLLFFSNLGKYDFYLKIVVPKHNGYLHELFAEIFITYRGNYFFSDSTMFFMIIGLLLLGLSSLFINDTKGPYILSKNPVQFLFHKIHLFTVDLLSSANEKEEAAQPFYSLVYVLFVFILVSNLQGLIPFTFTVTSHIVNTFFLALTVILYVSATIIQKHGIKYLLALFMPAGTPIVLGYLLIPIEILSFLFKVVSLSVRLFANIMAGHTLLKVILGFAWTILSLSELYIFFNIFPVAVLLLLTILEVAVSVIQAYVFSILTCLYLRDAFSGH